MNNHYFKAFWGFITFGLGLKFFVSDFLKARKAKKECKDKEKECKEEDKGKEKKDGCCPFGSSLESYLPLLLDVSLIDNATGLAISAFYKTNQKSWVLFMTSSAV